MTGKEQKANGRRLLIADDDAASLDLLVSFFSSLGYAVHAATDGNRALELGTTNAYDLVILDVNMPMYDGIEVLRFLRRRYVARPVRVIAVTAEGSQATRTAAADAGIDAFVTKPVDLKALNSLVESLLDEPRPHSHPEASGRARLEA